MSQAEAGWRPAKLDDRDVEALVEFHQDLIPAPAMVGDLDPFWTVTDAENWGDR